MQSVNLMKAEASFLLASVGEEQVQIQSADSRNKGWIMIPCHLLCCFDSLLLHHTVKSVSSAMRFLFKELRFSASFWGKQNCINYRFCSKCLVQILILFLNVSNRMVVLEAVCIMGIHWACVFWYFKAVLVELQVDDNVFCTGLGYLTREKCWILLLCQVSRAQKIFCLILCYFRRGRDCIFILQKKTKLNLYVKRVGFYLPCCILLVSIKSITGAVSLKGLCLKERDELEINCWLAYL